MINHELAHTWITSDGKRFLDKAKAVAHEETLKEREEETSIVKQWLNRIKENK